MCNENTTKKTLNVLKECSFTPLSIFTFLMDELFSVESILSDVSLTGGFCTARIEWVMESSIDVRSSNDLHEFEGAGQV